MKISLTQENLNKALVAVGRIVGARASLPVLTNILLSSDANRLKLSSTNLEIGINYWIGAKVEEEGSITVPARLIGEYVANLPNETLHLQTDKNVLELKTSGSQSHINGIAAEEFPSIPTIGGKPALSVDAKDLAEALAQVVVVASVDDARPVLNGIYVFSDGAELVLAATDSYRLAEKKLKLAKKPTNPIKFIVPARSVQELLRMLEGDEKVDILLDENQVLFKFGTVELVSRLIEGDFPDYRQLIPKDKEVVATIETSEFARVAKVAGLFARESASSVVVKADVESGQISIDSVASQVGDNTSKLKAKLSGNSSEVSLNSRYILDALSVISEPQLEFSITGKVNPCLLRPQGDDSYLHIIMPLRS